VNIVRCVSGKVHRDLKLENILVSKKEEEVEDITIKVNSLTFNWPILHLIGLMFTAFE